jgi:hypothetical protein
MLIQLLEHHRSSTALYIGALQREMMIREIHTQKGVVPASQRLPVFSPLFSQPYLRSSTNQTRLKKNPTKIDKFVCLSCQT